MSDDNVRRLPTVRTDRVTKLAGALSKVLELSDVSPAEHMTALLLVQKAIEEAVMHQEGPAGLQQLLVDVNERRKAYQTQWAYNKKDDPNG